MLTPQSELNLFQAHLYDRFGRHVNKATKDYLKEQIPVQVPGKEGSQTVSCPVNVPKWLESMQNNPN